MNWAPFFWSAINGGAQAHLALTSSLTSLHKAHNFDGSSTLSQPYIDIWRFHSSSYSVRSFCCTPKALVRLTPGGSEFFWDYICPFSGKSAKCIKEVVIPWLESHAKGKVKIFFRLQVQPWCVHTLTIVTSVAPPSSRIAQNQSTEYSTHHTVHRHSTSTLCHETALAVIRVKPDAFWDYSLALLANQDKFYDIPTSTKTPVETRENLVQLGVEKGILDEADAEEVKDLLVHKSTPNGGTAVTNDLKWCSACLFVHWLSTPKLLTHVYHQSSTRGRTISMFRPRSCGTVSRNPAFRAPGERRNGPNFLEIRLLFKCYPSVGVLHD